METETSKEEKPMAKRPFVKETSKEDGSAEAKVLKKRKHGFF